MRAKQMASLAFAVILISVVCRQSPALDDILRSMEKEFTRIVDSVSPAIVEIKATKGSLVEQQRTSVIRENVGTGIVIDKKGYIVTTESVVGGAGEIGVALADGRDFGAKIVGTDPETDIALIKIDAENLPIASLGDSDSVRAGSWIIAIGRSYGNSPTLSFGVVNGVEPLPDRPAYYDAIKINASVSPGNSGGGVIDMDGKVVGIIAAALAEPRAIDLEPLSATMELRLALNQAKAAEALAKTKLHSAKADLDRKKAWVEHGRAVLMDLQKAQMHYVSAQSQYEKALSDLELLVSQLQPPAVYRDELLEIEKLRKEIVGIREQLGREENINKMLEISEQWEQEQKARVENIRDVLERLQKEGASAKARPLRGRFFGEREESFAIPINFTKTIIADLMEDGEIERGWLGVSIQSVKYWDMERLGLSAAVGAIVRKVDHNSPAAKAGVRKDDVIIEFGGEKIRTQTELAQMVAVTKPHTKVSLKIIRDKRERTLDVEIGKKPK